MDRPLPGKPVSPWLDGAPGPEYPRLKDDVEVDVAVVGAGVVGVTAALLLRRAGADVALLEARQVGFGVSGNTTAKLSSLHALTYADFTSVHGREKARAYGEANEAGIARVGELASELEIDCELRRKPNYTYTESPEERSRVEIEVESATGLGLPASLVEVTDLPFPVVAAVKFDDQAEFHPYRYVSGLARAAAADGAQLFETTRAVALEGTTVRTEGGARVRAGQVIIAAHIPFLDRGLYFARTHPRRSYAIAVRINGRPPEGMYLSTERPAHSLRAHPAAGGDLLIVGGESHKAGQADAADRYRRLEAYARDRFPVQAVVYRWAAQDNMPADGLPFVGRLWPLSSRVLVATGFRKWGLAMGTTSAAMLTDAVLGRQGPWAEVFDPSRLSLRPAARSLALENANAGARFFLDRLPRRASAAGLERGQGRVVRSGLRQSAVYRDDEGELHALSARCTHLGCIVNWNSAERTWDCPCHGSRFSAGGEPLQGPAVRALKKRSQA
jgi:glycine/D-amino acid oxidase-like deaminating enzyme/nitrite reductase/ring-hydroxylating ferredoxin subunit